ncbi:MAG: 50S ribosomal protein L24, partial [Gemmatimonadetes bacterium 21-71-4]
MASLHVKRGDEVVVIAGSQKGKRGKILEVMIKAERVVVEGANMRKRHMPKSQEHPQGAIVEREAAI